VADPFASRVYVDAVHQAVNTIMRTNKASGFTVDDPVRLGPIHKLLAPGVEMMFVSSVFGKKDHQWYDHGRKYHHNDRVCEQLVRLPVGFQNYRTREPEEYIASSLAFPSLATLRRFQTQLDRWLQMRRRVFQCLTRHSSPDFL
jgi:hypothetical protein